jgi:hypothetical protein
MPNESIKQRCAAVIREIGVPAPFDVDDFCARLEGYRDRPIRVIAIPAGLGPLSGAWVSTAHTDYIYHPEGISPLHRAHIVLHEFSHMLLGHHGGPQHPRDLTDLLAPDLGGMMIGLILGRNSYTSAKEHDAEVMASLLLASVTRCVARRPWEPPEAPTPSTWGRALEALQRAWRQWRSYRDLHPLWSVLHQSVPQIALSPPRGLRHQIGFRLYRRVIEIRDGELALRPYLYAAVAEAAASAAAKSGLSADDLDTMVEATVLAAALQAKQAERRARHSTSCTPTLPGIGLDLHREIASLRRVSRAFASVRLRTSE